MAGGAGFTGTQKGMSKPQRVMFKVLLHSMLIDVLDHGDCIGSDEQAHKIADKIRGMRIRIHPPIKTDKRAYCKGMWIAPPKPYLERNKDIVNNTHMLIATPFEFEEQLRSGTWSTIRYAVKQGRPVHIIFPDGSVRIQTPTFVAEYDRPKMKKI